MPAPERGPVHELLARADAVAARYDATIAVHHTCEGGGLCAPCQAWDERLIEIERAERAKDRTR